MSPILPGQPGTLPIPPFQNTTRNICQNAMVEIGVVAPGEPIDPSELSFVLSKFNQIVDSWNTRKAYIFANSLQDFVLVPNLQPHTIGPAAVPPNLIQPTFLITGSRPVSIRNANIILNNTNPVTRQPIQPRDSDWWAKQRVQTIVTSIPTDFYYSADWPYGSIYLWPVPNTAYGLELQLETILQGSASLDTVFTFPPGYELALTLTLAEMICSAFERDPKAILAGSAVVARRAVKGLNDAPPRIGLDDFNGSSGKPRPSFNWYTGSTTK